MTTKRAKRVPVEARYGDPLSIFLEAREAKQPKGKRPARGRKPFMSGEHSWVGSAGAALACKEVSAAGNPIDASLFKAVSRLHGNQQLSYGEIVALSGDFYGSPSDLYEEQPAALPWLWEDNDLNDLKSLFDSEIDWIKKAQSGGTSPYPDYNVRMAWNAKAYVELAMRNSDHFGWHNVLAYCRYHGAALEHARRAAGKNSESWSRALFYNGFADHFLTDGFAAGHVRVPRAEIRAWCENKQYSEKLAGALSKLIHDQDGHVDTVHLSGESARGETDGLHVKNGNGDAWHTRCDGQLFLGVDSSSAPAVKFTVRAVADSVKELLVAWKTGKLPDDTYAATRVVPFPHPKAETLAAKFAPDIAKPQLDKLMKSVDWYANIPWIGAGLTATHVRELFAALPDLMTRFRANVRADVDRDPSISRRIAAPYIKAFLQIA